MIIPLNNARCTGLSLRGAVNLSAGGDDFEIDAYTGTPVERSWGRLVIAVDGIQAKAQMPIFRDHNHGAIVGYSTRAWKDGSFKVSGKFNSTVHADEVRKLAAEGFPWQASIGVSPLKINQIESGASDLVNGRMVNGPAEIWLESEVYETSFVPLGADSNTSVTVLSIQERTGSGRLDHMTVDERARLAWDADASLRHEFGGDFGAYQAFSMAVANGQVPQHVAQKPKEQTTGLWDHLPIDERIKKTWDASAELRAEFENDFVAFSAFEKAMAKGLCRVR